MNGIDLTALTERIRDGLEVAANGAESDRDAGRMLALRGVLDGATVVEVLRWLAAGAEAAADCGDEDAEIMRDVANAISRAARDVVS